MKRDKRTLHIVISDEYGDTLIGIKQPLCQVEESKTLLDEPYLIRNLINDSRTIIKLRKELKQGITSIKWSGK